LLLDAGGIGGPVLGAAEFERLAQCPDGLVDPLTRTASTPGTDEAHIPLVHTMLGWRRTRRYQLVEGSRTRIPGTPKGRPGRPFGDRTYREANGVCVTTPSAPNFVEQGWPMARAAQRF
jgi:hypothetical protein